MNTDAIWKSLYVGMALFIILSFVGGYLLGSLNEQIKQRASMEMGTQVITNLHKD